jgi:hypothetical protein
VDDLMCKTLLEVSGQIRVMTLLSVEAGDGDALGAMPFLKASPR